MKHEQFKAIELKIKQGCSDQHDARCLFDEVCRLRAERDALVQLAAKPSVLLGEEE